MKEESWIIVVDERRFGGLLAAARSLAGPVTALVVGPRGLAEAAAAAGPDKVLWFAEAEDVPAEAYAAPAASALRAADPRLVLASDAPAGRVLLAAAAAALGAALIASVRGFAPGKNGGLVVRRSVAGGRAVESLAVPAAAACIFDGADEKAGAAARPAPITEASAEPGAAFRILKTLPADAAGADLLRAARVVAAGAGVRAKADLGLIADLAAAAHAETACSLPLCDDMRWFPAAKVVGSSHSQIAPELYLAVGISGQPQHMSGVRDAKIVAAVNNDPEARIFKNCDYGIVGDLYKVVPALTAAFKGAR